MIVEIISISSNTFVIALIIWLIKSSTKREIKTIEKFANRPDFNQVDRRIEKVDRRVEIVDRRVDELEKKMYGKEQSICKTFFGHTHEGMSAKVTLK